MTKKQLFTLWGILYIVCAGLGFIPAPGSGLRIFLTMLSVVFFLPPAVLLYRAKKTGDRHCAALIRSLAALSLGLTAAALVLSFLTAPAGETVGVMVHCLLVVVSAPMVCSGYWALSLFLWACLLIAAAGGRGKN